MTMKSFLFVSFLSATLAVAHPALPPRDGDSLSVKAVLERDAQAINMQAKKGEINLNGPEPNDDYVSPSDQKLEGAYIHGQFVPPISVTPPPEKRDHGPYEEESEDENIEFDCLDTNGTKTTKFGETQYSLAAARAIRILTGKEEPIKYRGLTYPDHILGERGNNYLAGVKFDGKDALPSICQDPHAYSYEFPILRPETPQYSRWNGRMDPGLYRVVVASKQRMGSPGLGGLLASTDDISFCTITQPQTERTFTNCYPVVKHG